MWTPFRQGEGGSVLFRAFVSLKHGVSSALAISIEGFLSYRCESYFPILSNPTVKIAPSNLLCEALRRTAYLFLTNCLILAENFQYSLKKTDGKYAQKLFWLHSKWCFWTRSWPVPTIGTYRIPILKHCLYNPFNLLIKFVYFSKRLQWLKRKTSKKRVLWSLINKKNRLFTLSFFAFVRHRNQ
jgi:hypothetical protein